VVNGHGHKEGLRLGLVVLIGAYTVPIRLNGKSTGKNGTNFWFRHNYLSVRVTAVAN
jgi:hypothetical protein